MFNRILFTAFRMYCASSCLIAAPQAVAQEAGLDFVSVPYELPTDRSAEFQPLSSGQGQVQRRTITLPPRFFAGLTQHPRLPLADRARQTVAQYEKWRGQYIEVKLEGRRVMVGTLNYTTSDGFELRTGAIGTHWVKYSELASMPMPVDATGHKFLRGLEIGGLVVVAIVAIPIAGPFWAIACAAGDCLC
jgi:hypothetical protein